MKVGEPFRVGYRAVLSASVPFTSMSASTSSSISLPGSTDFDGSLGIVPYTEGLAIQFLDLREADAYGRPGATGDRELAFSPHVASMLGEAGTSAPTATTSPQIHNRDREIGSPILSPTGTPTRGTFNWSTIGAGSGMGSPLTPTFPGGGEIVRSPLTGHAHAVERGELVYAEPFIASQQATPSHGATSIARYIGCSILPIPSTARWVAIRPSMSPNPSSSSSIALSRASSTTSTASNTTPSQSQVMDPVASGLAPPPTELELELTFDFEVVFVAPEAGLTQLGFGARLVVPSEYGLTGRAGAGAGANAEDQGVVCSWLTMGQVVVDHLRVT